MLNKPQQDGPYPDRDIACQEALQDSFLDIAKTLTPDDIKHAAGGALPPALTTLAKKAQGSGWGLEESEIAISDLAQNLLDDMAAM
jgi:hypothetical protein